MCVEVRGLHARKCKARAQNATHDLCLTMPKCTRDRRVIHGKSVCRACGEWLQSSCAPSDENLWFSWDDEIRLRTRDVSKSTRVLESLVLSLREEEQIFVVKQDHLSGTIDAILRYRDENICLEVEVVVRFVDFSDEYELEVYGQVMTKMEFVLARPCLGNLYTQTKMVDLGKVVDQNNMECTIKKKGMGQLSCMQIIASN